MIFAHVKSDCQQLHIERVCKPFKPSLSRQKFRKYFNYFTTPKHRHHRRVFIEWKWQRSQAQPVQVGSVLMEFMQPVPAVPATLATPPRLQRKLSIYCQSHASVLARLPLLPPSRDWVRCCVGWERWAWHGVCWQMLFNLFQPQLTDVVMPIISIPDSTQAMLI